MIGSNPYLRTKDSAGAWVAMLKESPEAPSWGRQKKGGGND